MCESRVTFMNKDNLLWYDRKRIWCGLPWTFTKYGLSEDRFFVETGFFTTRHYDARLYRIMNTSMTRSILQKLFHLGTIHIDGTDKDLGCFDLVNVKNCETIKELLDEAIEKERVRNKVMVREYVSDADDDDHDVYDGES